MIRCILLDYRDKLEHTFMADQSAPPEAIRWEHKIYCPIDAKSVREWPGSVNREDNVAFFKRAYVFELTDRKR